MDADGGGWGSLCLLCIGFFVVSVVVAVCLALHLLGQVAVAAAVEVGNALADELECA